MAEKSAPELLTIQKFIFLLDDFHFTEFTNSLKSINATLPLKLTKIIRDKLPEFDTHETLCKKIYGTLDNGQRQNFNQLSSYTFKLSSCLALNYPAYLFGKISDIEKLVNEGNYKEANFLAETLDDIAERVEDFQVQICVLKFLSQQAFLVKDHVTGIKLNGRLEKAFENEGIYIKLQTELRRDLMKDKLLSENEFAERKAYYKSFQNHTAHRIIIVSSYGYILSMTQNDQKFFTRTEDLEILNVLEKELRNHAYLVSPFMTDIEGHVKFLKLNSPLYNPAAKETIALYNELSEHFDGVKFWKSYLNMSELFLITISTTRLLTAYHYLIHRPDYYAILTPEDKETLRVMIEKCEALIKKDYYAKNYEFGLRSITMLYGALLIISGGDNVKKGISEIESLLIAYQQVNLKASTDSIYLCLMVGYFSIKDYAKCAHTFKRYTKNSKGKSVFEQNDTKIYAYYYIAQWLIAHSRQYPAKLEVMLKDIASANNDGPPKTIMELVDYFKVPVHV